MIALLAASFVASLGQSDEALNPALTLSKASFDKIWTVGAREGHKRKNADKAMNLACRQIDSYHISKMHKSGCSWAYMLHPRLLVYNAAHDSAEKYWTEEKIKEKKDDLEHYCDKPLSYLGFFVYLQEMPSFHGAYGTLSRYADPSNLKDVHCVLKVGKERIIQPMSQPGDLTLSKSDHISFYSIPTTTYVSGTTETNVRATGSGGWANATATSTSSYAVTNYTDGSDSYSIYKGEFLVLFPTTDSNNKPLITDKDKSIELIVVKKSSELKAKYDLKTWNTALE